MRQRPPLEVGAEYNDWTVVVQINLVVATCECKCGAKCDVIITHLLSGRSKRCRTCANKRPSYKWRPLGFDGGVDKYPTKLKTAVTDAIRRCTDESDRCYYNWGGRGIKVCQEWIDDPRLFIEHLMTLEGWDNPELILDRIDNDGNYEIGNLRWTTYLESGRNQRRPSTHRKKARGEFSM